MTHSAFLFRELVRRDFAARYVGSAFGFLWSFAQPIWQLALFSFVFGGIMGGRVPEALMTTSFAVFVFTGLLPWTALQEGVQRSTTAITDNAALVSKLRFPAAFLVATVVATALIHEAIAGAIFVLYLAVTGELSWPTLPVLLLTLPLQAGLTVGLGLLLASVHVFFRDSAQVVGMAMFGWFYLTPIVYPASMVPASMLSIIEANPLTTLVRLYRWSLLGAPPPSGTRVALLFGLTILLLFAGGWTFRRLKPAFVDEL